jgi:hypothetical protein
VNPGTHKSLNPFGINLNLVNIGELILVGASLVGGKLRVRISWHDRSPCLPLEKPDFSPSSIGQYYLFLTRKRGSVKKRGLHKPALFKQRYSVSKS